MFSDGIFLKAYGENPIVGRPFQLICNTETDIVNTVEIKSPDETIIGSCVPASPPFNATCDDAADYEASLNESANTIQINTNSMAPDVNGTWACLHNGQTATFTLDSPLTEIINETFHLTPFTKNVTTMSVSMTVTFGCINKLVHFEWYLQDESSQAKTKLKFINTVEVKSSPCTDDSRFYTYTETRSSSNVANPDGRYRIGVEVHYSNEVTALQSIQYFDTSFIFNPTTTATTEQQTITNATTEQQTTEQQTITNATTTMGTNDISKDTEIQIYIGTGTGLGGISSIVIIIFFKRRKKNTKNSQDRTENNSGNPERVSMTNEPPVDYDTRNDRKANKQNMCV